MQVFGVSLCETKNIDFNQRFLGQFILTKSETIAAPGWDALPLTNWILHRAKNDKTVKIVDKDDIQIGWFLGVGVTADGDFISGKLSLPYSSKTGRTWRNAEKQIEGIAGCYCAIIDTGKIQRIYGDPVGDFPVVYNPDEQIVASTTFLALTRNLQWNEKFDRARVLAGEMHFSLQEMPDPSLKRALPNHYLDLNSFNSVRHWPLKTTELLEPVHSVHDNLDQIGDRLKQIIRAIARSAPTIIPISGGQDSRNLIGIAAEDAKHLKFGFAWRFHKMSHLDARIGTEIANRVGLPFFTYPHIKTTKHERLQYFMRTGYTEGGASLRVLGLQKQIPGGNIILRGNVMELLRANQWNTKSIKYGIPRPAFAIQRLLIDNQSPSDTLLEQWRPQYESWADTLPDNAKHRQLDFGFAEHLLPNTLGVRNPGFPDNFVVNPFSDRHLMQLTMQIPPEIRKQNLPNKYLLEKYCGQFADIPFERELSANPSLLPLDQRLSRLKSLWNPPQKKAG